MAKSFTGPNCTPELDLPLVADDLPEFHAARLLILIEKCGIGPRKPRIRGRTKLAKLDFFLRYPEFFARAIDEDRRTRQSSPARETQRSIVESPMVRYRFGPWDFRYFDTIAYLASRGLIEVRTRNVDEFVLTESGRALARDLIQQPAFAALADRAEDVGALLGDWNGSRLKELIYRLFDKEVASLPYGARIVGTGEPE